MPHSTCLACLYRHRSTHTLPRPAPPESWSLSLLPGVLPVVSLPSWCPSHPWLPATYSFFSSSQVTYILLLPLFESQRSSLNKFPSCLWLYHSMGVTYCAFFHSCSLAYIKISVLFLFFLSCHSPAWAGTWSSPALGVGFTPSVILVLEPLEETTGFLGPLVCKWKMTWFSVFRITHFIWGLKAFFNMKNKSTDLNRKHLLTCKFDGPHLTQFWLF